VRIDSGVGAGDEISPNYDPMVAKLICWDADRQQATQRMLRALAEYEIGGLTTLIPFHRALLATEQWDRGETCRDLVESAEWLASTAPAPATPAADQDAEEEEKVARNYTVEVSGRRFDVNVIGPPSQFGTANGSSQGATATRQAPRRAQRGASSGGGPDTLTSPLQGNMWKVLVKQGDTVEEGQLLCIIEAMKMENEIMAHKAGVIVELPITEGEPIAAGAPIATISAAPAGD
jgi:acetyl-CoA/propionyl-CoA carboxylase biotin carboxyl carrier protein